MRISDWSSDVCSSDLTPEVVDTAPVPRPYLARSEKLPWSKDEVTAERLTRLLPNKYPGIVVEHLNLDRFIDSHTSKMLVTVALNDVCKDDGIPDKLCIKSNFSGQIGRASCRERVCMYV